MIDLHSTGHLTGVKNLVGVTIHGFLLSVTHSRQELRMRVTLELTKANKRLHEGTYEIDDSESFGAAWEDVWAKVREDSMAKATSIGALMDTMHESVIDQLNGATIKLTKR